MARSARCRATQPAHAHPRLVHRAQRGAATAEFAVGVIAAVLIAVLLLHLVLSGFFDVLLQSLFERGLSLAVDLLATPMSWSLSDIAGGSLSRMSAVSGSAAGGAGEAVVDMSRTVVDTASAAGSSAFSGVRALASSIGSIAEATADATVAALRWVGGPVSSALSW